MPLGQGIGEMWGAVRHRVELSGCGPTWDVTAGTFEEALDFARERFGDPVVLSRKDRDRWWPRVTLTVTTDRVLAVSAPNIDELANTVVPVQRRRRGGYVMPLELEAIFAHQEQLRMARDGAPGDDGRP